MVNGKDGAGNISRPSVTYLVMKRIVGLGLLLLTGCTNESATVETLQKAGFRDIRTTGYAWLACGDDDTFATKFQARNPTGQLVNGVVCCGLIGKGCTIRW